MRRVVNKKKGGEKSRKWLHERAIHRKETKKRPLEKSVSMIHWKVGLREKRGGPGNIYAGTGKSGIIWGGNKKEKIEGRGGVYPKETQGESRCLVSHT